MIGPCGHTEFASLMGISAKHLYRVIIEGTVWKDPGPTRKKFYFFHRDPPTHRRLREAFERRGSKRA
jgi:hypothetical protein